jgi:hypothetical protein
MNRRRWDFEMPGTRRSHAGHEMQTVIHRHWGGRPRMAARLCLTCYLIVREWHVCGRRLPSGRRCRRPAQVVRGAPWPCVQCADRRARDEMCARLLRRRPA